MAETEAVRSGNREDGAVLSAKPLKALDSCRLCPRACGVNRLEGKRGICRAGRLARVASVSLHHGEEPPISGTGGSGTIFFAHCNLTCLFCQNYPISQLDNGREMDGETLASELLKLQARGAHNVNFVTPTPHVPQMAEAVMLARQRGLTIPIVYNSNGYDSLDALALTDGVVDIYLPDAKYRSGDLAQLASGASDYPEANDAALKEMARQTGFLKLDRNGIAVRGMLIRHLVLPGRVEETQEVLAYLRETFGRDIPISLMGQYFPAYKAFDAPGFDRKLSDREYDQTVETARRLGLRNVFIQEI